MANRPVPRTLTRAQQARRQRVVDAAMALGLDGGYEAVQMRDVAARADVAMGTVYRYFTSKDHLLAAALVHWVEQLDSRLAQLPAQGDTAAERVIDVLDRALRAMGRQPQLVGAVFTALASPDPAAIECQQQVSVLMEGIITRAIGEPHPPDLERPGPDPRPRLVLGPGGLGQRVEQHGPGPRRAGGGRRAAAARRHLRRGLTDRRHAPARRPASMTPMTGPIRRGTVWHAFGHRSARAVQAVRAGAGRRRPQLRGGRRAGHRVPRAQRLGQDHHPAHAARAGLHHRGHRHLRRSPLRRHRQARSTTWGRCSRPPASIPAAGPRTT